MPDRPGWHLHRRSLCQGVPEEHTTYDTCLTNSLPTPSFASYCATVGEANFIGGILQLRSLLRRCRRRGSIPSWGGHWGWQCRGSSQRCAELAQSRGSWARLEPHNRLSLQPPASFKIRAHVYTSDSMLPTPPPPQCSARCNPRSSARTTPCGRLGRTGGKPLAKGR